MNDFDHLDLDGRLLQLLWVVHEEGSVTRAAQRLGVTQSAVSHGLDRLRAIVGDALFVKSGRGIAPTAMATVLAGRARQLLDDLRHFSVAAGFEPARLRTTLTIAANDLQRDVLLPPLLRRLRAEAPGLMLHVVPSGAPTPAVLREQHCDLLITPRPPVGDDIFQKRLFEDHFYVFYDASQRTAPLSLADYCAAEHVTVLYTPRRMLDVDEWMLRQGIERRFVATVPGLAAMGAMVRGGPWIATAPSLMALGAMRDLSMTPVPLPMPAMPMYLVWHQRHQDDPMHRWLRQNVTDVAQQLQQVGYTPAHQGE